MYSIFKKHRGGWRCVSVFTRMTAFQRAFVVAVSADPSFLVIVGL